MPVEFKNEKYKEKKRKQVNSQVDSCTVCIDNVIQLEPRALQLLFVLAENSNSECVICDINGKFADKKQQLADVLNVSVNNDTLADMMRKDVIRKIKFGNMRVYVINPFILYKGRTVHPDVYMAFGNSKFRYVYSENYYEEVLI